MRSDAPALRPLRLLVLALALAPLPADGALLDHGFRIEGERMLRPGMWRFSGTFATESDIRPGVEPITGTPVDVNAIRFPFSWRYGFTSRLEVGTDVQFERDKGTDLGPAKLFDAGGVSNWDLVAKCKVFPWTTFVGHVGVYGNNKLYGGSDPLDYGLDILLTLPLNLPIGMPNLMHFNTGIRFKGGNPNIDLNTRLDARGYMDPIHLGWSLIVSPRAKWAAVGEILVRRSPYGLEEEAELTLGTRYAYTERSTLMASIARGVTDGSPNWALRLGFETTYGSQTERQGGRGGGRAQVPTGNPGGGPAGGGDFRFAPHIDRRSRVPAGRLLFRRRRLLGTRVAPAVRGPGLLQPRRLLLSHERLRKGRRRLFQGADSDAERSRGLSVHGSLPISAEPSVGSPEELGRSAPAGPDKRDGEIPAAVQPVGPPSHGNRNRRIAERRQVDPVQRADPNVGAGGELSVLHDRPERRRRDRAGRAAEPAGRDRDPEGRDPDGDPVRGHRGPRGGLAQSRGTRQQVSLPYPRGRRDRARGAVFRGQAGGPCRVDRRSGP